MNQKNQQNNINQLANMKLSLLSDFTKQKNFVLNINKIVNIISSGIKELIPSIENINNILPYFINELGISFCDLINETNIIKFYFNNYLISKSEVIKNILVSFIQIFNFESSEKTPGDTLIQLLSTYDNNFTEISDKKRTEKTEIEEIYDILNSTYSKSANEEKEKLKKELLEKIGLLEKNKTYSISTIQYLKEKIETIDNNVKIIDLNNSKNDSNNINNTNSIFKELNYYINNLQISNNFINLLFNSNNELSEEEFNLHKKMPLEERKYLIKDEQLMEEENEYTEFKNYSYPFSQEKIDEIKRQYCGFLNSKGGRIYIGITDLRVVKGLHLDYKARDTIKNELINYTYDFYPKCRIDKISVYFLRIKSFQTRRYINNLTVIKIIVMPGEPYNLYSINNKTGYISTLRLPGQCINLTAEEIYTEIMRRAELYKQRHITEQNNKNEVKEIRIEEMPEENIEEININEEENTENESDEKSNKKKVNYVVKITNIDTSLKIKDINRYFNGCGCFLQKFPAEEGKSLGYGEIHFSKKETAKAIIQKYNNINLCGSKKILMKLTKRVTKGE